jgi:hypothetical protein
VVGQDSPAAIQLRGKSNLWVELPARATLVAPIAEPMTAKPSAEGCSLTRNTRSGSRFPPTSFGLTQGYRVRRVYHERLRKLARVTLVASLKPLHAQIFDGPDAINRSESLDIYSTVHKLALIFDIVTLVAARLSLHSIKREWRADWLTRSLISAIFARSCRPPVAALITSADSSLPQPLHKSTIGPSNVRLLFERKGDENESCLDMQAMKSCSWRSRGSLDTVASTPNR